MSLTKKSMDINQRLIYHAPDSEKFRCGKGKRQALRQGKCGHHCANSSKSNGFSRNTSELKKRFSERKRIYIEKKAL
jgi:hypothetical protein